MEKIERGVPSNFLIQTISSLIVTLFLNGCGTVALSRDIGFQARKK